MLSSKKALLPTSARQIPGVGVLCRTPARPRYRGAVPFRARKGDDDDSTSTGLASITNTLSSAVDTVAAMVPESVPRPVARGGVAVVGALVVFGLVKQVISGIFTLAVLGGLGYWYLTKDSGGSGGGKDDDDDFKPSSSKRGASEDLNDPLSDARRIMDKYK